MHLLFLISYFWQPTVCWDVSPCAASLASIYCQCTVHTRVLKKWTWGMFVMPAAAVGGNWLWLVYSACKAICYRKVKWAWKGARNNYLIFEGRAVVPEDCSVPSLWMISTKKEGSNFFSRDKNNRQAVTYSVYCYSKSSMTWLVTWSQEAQCYTLCW